MSSHNERDLILLQPTTPDYVSLEEAPVCIPGPDGSCSICADAGEAGRVLELRPNGMALVQMEGGTQEVAVDLIDEPQVGDLLLVHLGFAIGRVDEGEGEERYG